MDDVIFRIMQDMGQDAGAKAHIVNRRKAPFIVSMYAITKPSSKVSPAANSNAEQAPDMAYVRSTQFADNRNEAVYGVVRELVMPTSRRIMTNIFADAVAKVVTMTPVERMSMIAKTKTEPKREASVFNMEREETPHYNNRSNVHYLFPQHKQVG